MKNQFSKQLLWLICILPIYILPRQVEGQNINFSMEAFEDYSLSCPYVYTWNGTAYVQDNDIYSVARYASGEYRDFYRLEKPLVVQSGKYKIKIKEIDNETSYTDLVGLIAVDHASNVKIAPDAQGNIYAYTPASLVYPYTAVSNTNENVKSLLESENNSGFHAYSQSYVEINFGSVSVSQGARLIVKMKGFNQGQGNPMPFIGQPALLIQYLNSSNIWTEAGRLKPRMDWSTGAFDLSSFLPNYLGEVKVRIYSISHDLKYHDVDFVALSIGTEPGKTVTPLSLSSAIYKGNNVISTLSSSDNVYVNMQPNDSFELEYTATSQTLNQREFIFVSEGYYVPSTSNTYFVYTWDGTSWAQRGSFSYPSYDYLSNFNLTSYLPDPNGEYKVRVFQNGTNSNYQAWIDYVGLTSGSNTGTLLSARDLRNNQDVKPYVQYSDNNPFVLYNGFGYTGGYNRWSEYNFSLLIAKITAGDPTTFCAGGSVTLSANTGSGYTYQWQNNANNIIGATSSTYVATTSGNYTVVVTSGTLTATSSVTTVTVNPLPIVTATNLGPVCIHDTIKLFTSPGSSYAWTGPNSYTSTQQNPVLFDAAIANAGTYTVTVTDANGCFANNSTSVVVNTLPVVTAGSNSPICAGGTLNLTSSAAVSYIWSGPNSFSSTDQNPSISNVSSSAIGTYFVKVTGTNGCRNDASTVVAVNQLPTITGVNGTNTICSGTTTTLTASSAAPAFNWYDAPTGGNLLFTGAVYTTANLTSNTIFYVDVTSMNCTSASRTSIGITVNVPPTFIVCPTNQSINTTTGLCTSPLVYSATAIGTPLPILTYVFTGATTGNGSGTGSGSVFNKGVTTVTLMASNSCGSTQCSYTVTVNDITAPIVSTLTGALNATLQCSNASGITAALLQQPAATDNCTASPSIHLVSDVTTPDANCANAYVRVRTWNFTDASNNTSTNFVQTITVIDNTAPVVTCPDNITAYTTTQCGVNVSYAATAIDNCGSLTISYSKASGSFFNLGSTQVTATATDVCGNASFCTFTVTVIDATPPQVITQNISVNLNSSGNASISASQINNGSYDNCAIASVIVSPNTFTCANVGPNTVTLTVTDVNSNVATSTAVVTIVDNIAPIAICRNITVTIAGGSVSITPAQIDDGSNDACGIKSLSLSKTSFNCSNIGANAVTLTVTDNNNNVSTCSATVTILGVVPTCTVTSAPRNVGGVVIGSTTTLAATNQMFLGYGAQSMNITCTAPASGAGPFTYSWSGSGLNNTAIANPIFTPTAGGNYTLTCTVTNSYGCQTTCSIVICVIDARATGGSPSNPKVYLCHVPPGNPNNPQTLNISVSAVPAHLGQHGGDRLGACAQTCGTLKTNEVIGDIYTMGDADLIVYPNPSTSTFNFRLESESNEPVTISIYDLRGKLISEESFSIPSDMMVIGEELANGIYFTIVKQGEYSKTVKIQKIN